MKLSECPTRVALRLTDIELPRRSMLRMQEIGLRIGAQATIVQRAGFGGLVLNIAGSRVAVDHRSAKKIEAELVAA
ncbi:FeoA family protein [Trueperella pecoris]|uniref:FeoA family protein n=1 Tax=Trueperella pecoris TaxID=2733571 RepID=UPI00186B9F91|nr:FeoA family protein [Trueperella pecoris]QOQ39361.1 ferrous iron transport protein A [Trueperella pecoris]QTG75830.1 ferrous iron transport protein A [Trueperella pecoris]